MVDEEEEEEGCTKEGALYGRRRRRGLEEYDYLNINKGYLPIL